MAKEDCDLSEYDQLAKSLRTAASQIEDHKSLVANIIEATGEDLELTHWIRECAERVRRGDWTVADARKALGLDHYDRWMAGECSTLDMIASG